MAEQSKNVLLTPRKILDKQILQKMTKNSSILSNLKNINVILPQGFDSMTKHYWISVFTPLLTIQTDTQADSNNKPLWTNLHTDAATFGPTANSLWPNKRTLSFTYIDLWLNYNHPSNFIIKFNAAWPSKQQPKLPVQFYGSRPT